MWVAVKNYEGLYEVSSDGKVRSLDREVQYRKGFSNKIFKKKLKSKNISVVTTEYDFIRCCQVTLFKDGNKETLILARVMLESFYPDQDGTDKIAMFKDGFTDHVTLDNLYWGTKREQAIRSHENAFTKTSAYVGIYQNSRGLFVANSYIGDKKHYIGTYASDQDARDAQIIFEESFKKGVVVNRKQIEVENYVEPTDGFKALSGEYYGLYEACAESGVIRLSKSKRELSNNSIYVRLTDRSGVTKRVLRKVIIAKTFLENKHSLKHVININGDVYDCSVSNLMWHYTNRVNNRESASGFIGVRHDQVHNCWSARFNEKFLGNFETEYDAYNARKDYLIANGHFFYDK